MSWKLGFDFKKTCWNQTIFVLAQKCKKTWALLRLALWNFSLVALLLIKLWEVRKTLFFEREFTIFNFTIMCPWYGFREFPHFCLDEAHMRKSCMYVMLLLRITKTPPTTKTMSIHTLNPNISSSVQLLEELSRTSWPWNQVIEEILKSFHVKIYQLTLPWRLTRHYGIKDSN